MQVGWGISASLQTDKLYDALGSTTFAALAIGTLTYAKYYYARQILATVLVVVWAARLGGFLVFRVIKTGKDSRFDEAKKQPCELLCHGPRRVVYDEKQGMAEAASPSAACLKVAELAGISKYQRMQVF